MTDRFTPVADARAHILAACSTVAGTQRVPLRDALGRVLAADVISPVSVPPHDNSAMDGYAVRHADLSADADTRLTIVGQAFAGHGWSGEVAAGQTVRIMTGAVMPAGADTIVIQETARLDGDAVIVPPGQKAGQHRRRAGEDLRAGEPALRAGRLLRPADVGLAASLGIPELTVHRRVRVGVLSTGDEVMSIGEAPREGGIYDSNRYTLTGMLTRLGCEVIDLGVARDTREALSAALESAVGEVDAIITSGGVSVGEADFVREILASLGEVTFWKIAMKPGRPMAFGTLGKGARSTLLFGLPGNPVATMVTFHFFARDALLKLMGVSPASAPIHFAALSDTAMKKQPGRTEYQRGILELRDGRWHVAVTGAQGSGILRSMCDANCIIVLGDDCGNVAVGDAVSVIPFEGLI
ncbi:gephyrin-like molybdotransferase Glp [Methyloversatilis sp.]|uniref:molybdopterin molybdotransferase MoeA n=1 Tax=Methyloversatilis sp. TaxID=2569862 RepID=UPI0027328BAC|nr:gephyrin-like molybdotransferase Glp [Methyloversatilis sp.]MDP3453870.1 molybdopterin molybdotransferase MoeA [Methyloversatilis sp.]MDP3576561.1 molybdopterin molybdotransferase MoeA [Methyloversatilis sp.]